MALLLSLLVFLNGGVPILDDPAGRRCGVRGRDGRHQQEHERLRPRRPHCPAAAALRTPIRHRSSEAGFEQMNGGRTAPGGGTAAAFLISSLCRMFPAEMIDAPWLPSLPACRTPPVLHSIRRLHFRLWNRGETAAADRKRRLRARTDGRTAEDSSSRALEAGARAGDASSAIRDISPHIMHRPFTMLEIPPIFIELLCLRWTVPKTEQGCTSKRSCKCFPHLFYSFTWAGIPKIRLV